jgi:hypothetical protein
MQTDWGISAIKFRVGPDPGNLSEQITAPLTELSGALSVPSSATVKLYGTYVPLELPKGNEAPRGISSTARYELCLCRCSDCINTGFC